MTAISRETLRSDRLTIRMAPPLAAALAKAASSNRRTRSDMLIVILEDWLRSEKFLKSEKLA